MRIVIPLFNNVMANDGTVVRTLRVAQLIEKGHEVTLVTRSKRKLRDTAKGIEMLGLRFLIRLAQSVWWNLKLSFLLLTKKADIVYCSNEYFGFPSIYVWSKVRGYSIIYEAHDILSQLAIQLRWPSALVKLFLFLERFIVRNVDYLVALAPNILEHYSTYNARTALIPVFVDTDQYRPLSKSPGSRDFKRVGIIGPFVINDARKKEHLHFLYSNLEKFDRRLRLVVIGQCSERIQHERIEYTGYIDSTEAYADLLARLDAVIVPEKTATTGPLNKIIEPMSCSVPVFTTPQGMVGLYWVESHKDLLVFEENELVSKMNELIFDNAFMAQIGSNARVAVERYYSKNAIEDNLNRILEAVMKGKSGGDSRKHL
jgi:glycosyltransferase involved in cell wall biosynthesis